MHTAEGSACIGTQRLRGLLESDRLAADEARPRPEHRPLQTTAYKVALRRRIRQRFREDPRIRIGSVMASAGLVLAVVMSVTDPFGGVRATQTGASVALVMGHETLSVRSTAPVVSHQPLATPAPLAPPREHARRDRLQHARRVLRRAGAEGAAQARVLLEDLLRAKPKNGRAYAALAEACLRLQDAGCARTAVTKAVARQPRRVRYKALAARIDRTFAQADEGD